MIRKTLPLLIAAAIFASPVLASTLSTGASASSGGGRGGGHSAGGGGASSGGGHSGGSAHAGGGTAGSVSHGGAYGGRVGSSLSGLHAHSAAHAVLAHAVSHGYTGHHHHHHGFQSASAKNVTEPWGVCPTVAHSLFEHDACNGPTKLPAD